MNRCSKAATLFCYIFALTLVCGELLQTHAQTTPPKQQVETSALKKEINEFLAKEVAAHFGNIQTLNPPPDRVFNALSVGDFPGKLARALATGRLWRQP